MLNKLQKKFICHKKQSYVSSHRAKHHALRFGALNMS